MREVTTKYARTPKKKIQEITVELKKTKITYLYSPLLRARPRLLSVQYMSPDCVAEQIHTIGPLRPGLLHPTKPER